MKKLWLASLFALVLVLGACGGGGNDENAQEEPTEEETDQGTNDHTQDEPAEEDQSGNEDANKKNDEAGEGSTGTVDTAAAEEAYKTNCASCHGGELGGGFGPSLKEVGANYSKDEIAHIIQNGQGQMPAQGQVNDDDTQLIASWLATKK